jgi:putative ABC transport system substrate-binding protein
MRRRDFITLVGGAVAAWPLAARSQQPAMPVVGVLLDAWVPHLRAAFVKGLAEEGYVEGKNVALDVRFAHFKPELLPEAARDLVRLKVDVIFAGDPGGIAPARNATSSIPIVAIDLESDPIAKGYVQSLSRPGGNLTGMFLDLPELSGKQVGLLKEIVSGKQVGLLKEIVPQLSRIAIFGIPGLNVAQFAATETVVRTLGLQAEIIEVRSPDDFEGALDAAKTRHVEAGILLSSPIVFVTSKQIAELALARQLPLISLFGEFPKVGGLMAYGPNLAEMYRRLGGYVGKILHGAKPSELPIQRPEKFDLVINLKTAAALGLDVPMQLQQLADEVIE